MITMPTCRDEQESDSMVLLHFIYLCGVHELTHASAVMRMWRSEDTLFGISFFLPPRGAGKVKLRSSSLAAGAFPY